MKLLVLISCALVVVSGVPVDQDESVARLIVSNFVDCVNSDLSLCLKEHALRATERLNGAKKLNIIEGVTLYNNHPREAKSLEPLSDDIDERKKQVTARLWESTTDLLQNSDLELSYGGEEEEDSSRALDTDEARGKKKKLKKKLKILIPIAILAKIKAIAIALGALLIIAASVFKLAVLAKIAFLAKAAAIIKYLIYKKQHSGWQEEVVVAHEDHGHEHHYEPHGHGGGWEGGWSRRNAANDIAYNGYQ